MAHPTSPSVTHEGLGRLGRLAAIGCVIAAIGCDSAAAAPPASTANASDTPASSALVASASSPARVLAMADPGGTTPVDVEVEAAQQWVKRLPRSSDKLIELGRAWVIKARHAGDPGFYLNAQACADLATELDPKSRLARELTAQVLLNQHRFVEAKDACEQVLGEDPEAFITLGVYSDTLLELGRIEGAIKAAERMVDFKPNLASYVRASFLQWLRNDLDGALGSAKLAIESSVDHTQPEPRAYAMVQTASYFWHRGDYEGADAGYKKALSIFTDYAPALVGRARVAMARGDAASAVELLRMADKESPLAETAWRLGDACAAAGDQACADQAYAKVVERGRKEDHRTLAQFFAVKNRDIDEALRLTQKELELRPGLYTHDARAWALYRAGKLDQAKQHIEQAARLGTPDAQLHYHHGAILIAAGDKDRGRKLVEKALALNPKFDPTGAPEAAQVLESTK
jgi:tetratricopeptide (TPR) repeat protein